MRKLFALLLILSLVAFSATSCFGKGNGGGNEGGSEGGSENGGSEGGESGGENGDLPYDPANPGDDPYLDPDGWT